MRSRESGSKELESRGWSGVGGFRVRVGGVGVGGNRVGFEEVQVRGWGSRRWGVGVKGVGLGSEKFGSRGRVGIREVGWVGVEV